jgi:hypothetical protein
MANFHQQTNETNSEALRLFYKAIELDPDFALPHGLVVSVTQGGKHAAGRPTTLKNWPRLSGWLAERLSLAGMMQSHSIRLGLPWLMLLVTWMPAQTSSIRPLRLIRTQLAAGTMADG